MDNTNFPSATQHTTATTPKKSSGPKNLIIGLLAAAVVGLGGYLAYDKNKNSETIQKQETQIATVSDQKSEIQKNFDASLARLDSMTGINTNLQSQLVDKNGEIAKVKTEIRSILNKSNATTAELARAKELINSLNGKINGLQEEVAKLTNENKTLNEEKVVLVADKTKLTEDLAITTSAKVDLEKKVDVASTLNASNIMITPINVKKNGREKESTVAKRVDKLVVSFDVDNRIAQAGTTDVYVLVIGPDGQPIKPESTGGTFTTRESGEMTFTAKVPVEIEAAHRKNVEFAFAPGSNFQKGNYTVQIYQNGFLIGESTKELKKGGLFS
jgi:hypothetical protein